MKLTKTIFQNSAIFSEKKWVENQLSGKSGLLWGKRIKSSSPQSSSGDRSGASEGGYACLPGSYILSGGLARILVHPSLKIRQHTVLYSDSIPLAIITLIRMNTCYYVLLRIFQQKCCFMMSCFYPLLRVNSCLCLLWTRFRGGLQ